MRLAWKRTRSRDDAVGEGSFTPPAHGLFFGVEPRVLQQHGGPRESAIGWRCFARVRVIGAVDGFEKGYLER